MRAVVTSLALIVAFAATFLFPLSSFADDGALTSQLENLRAKYTLPSLAAAVTKGGRIVAKGVTGKRMLGGDTETKIDDRFHLGSDTKAMTATIAAMMVEDGKLSWTSTIGDVLGADMPGLTPAFSKITLEQLLSHSSGIPTDDEEMIKLYFSDKSYDYSLHDYRRRIIAEWGSKNAPKIPEGSPFQYANFGYVIAGAMIEEVSGEAWESLITTRIFEPLGLTTAGLGPQATFGRYDAAIGHRIDDDGKIIPMPWGPAADVPAVMGPAGNAHMSISDFAIWADWNAGVGRRGPALVKPETVERLHTAIVTTPEIKNPKPGTPKTGQYALGWGLAKMDWTSRPVLTHNGSNSLNLATILVDSDHDIGIVVTTNFPGEKADAAVREMVEWLYRRYGPNGQTPIQ
ncbi:serine hydrolase domain-containing protein [Filomicrobium sp.]|uniref:serine hydrolase domain-containing protein n=1 Tax=Filomicrobium sp. TaxID=2024831 RepID=UPI00258B1872|nr:serine hydrolase domain-containing protein [Filomicrobium sp.]MCV0371320.1 beta-lactamase family protein [Filomicrobium sp.]